MVNGRGIHRIPNNRAPNHQLSIGWWTCYPRWYPPGSTLNHVNHGSDRRNTQKTFQDFRVVFVHVVQEMFLWFLSKSLHKKNHVLFVKQPLFDSSRGSSRGENFKTRSCCAMPLFCFCLRKTCPHWIQLPGFVGKRYCNGIQNDEEVFVAIKIGRSKDGMFFVVIHTGRSWLKYKTRWWFQICFIFNPTNQPNGLKPPTRRSLLSNVVSLECRISADEAFTSMNQSQRGACKMFQRCFFEHVNVNDWFSGCSQVVEPILATVEHPLSIERWSA